MSMDKDAFWALIDAVNREVDNANQKAILRITKEKLMALSPEDITMWSNIQYHYVDLADTKRMFTAGSKLNGWISDDGFMDFRMWLISRGKEAYVAALKDPDSLARLDVSGMARFELYGYVSQEAYKKAGFAGDPWDVMRHMPLTTAQKEGIRAEIEYSPRDVMGAGIDTLSPNRESVAPDPISFMYEQN